MLHSVTSFLVRTAWLLRNVTQPPRLHAVMLDCARTADCSIYGDLLINALSPAGRTVGRPGRAGIMRTTVVGTCRHRSIHRRRLRAVIVQGATFPAYV